MDANALLGPAVLAASVSGLAAAVIALLNTRATRALQRERFDFESKQLERKVSSDIELAERKVALDRSLADWKRRTELAEQVLAGFYNARDLFSAARSPGSFGGEGASRKREENESADEARYRDAAYAPFERLQRNNDVFVGLQAHRYRFIALFGAEAAEPFDELGRAFSEVRFATQVLTDPGQRTLSDRLRRRYEGIIWAIDEETPTIQQRVNQAVEKIEAVCRPILEAKPPE